MNPWKWIRRAWYWRLRRLDLEILWPQCKAHGQTIDDARRAFARHAEDERAWQELEPAERRRRLESLE